jgi:hypothetical protein
MMQIQKSLGELTANVGQMKTALASHHDAMRSDFRWTWSGLAGATVLLTGALIFGYFRLEDRQVRLADQQTVLGAVLTRSDDRQTTITASLTRLEVRQRTSPVPPSSQAHP